MNSDLTATATQKVGQDAHNPFNQIVQLEQEQAARLEQERVKLSREMQTAKDQSSKKIAELEDRLKKNATTELTEFKNTEPVALLKEAKSKATSIEKQYREKFVQRSPDVVKNIVSTYLESL